MLTLLLLMQPAAQPVAPHPTITEVLYAVPRQGDANKDGARSATGDEFIELINPHPAPINLKGYLLRDAKRDAAAPAGQATPPRPNESSFRFTFPDLTLKPGEVVVLFNGFESAIPGPVGTRDAAAAKNPSFNHAYVFSAKADSKYIALANDGDCITLFTPAMEPLECVYWGPKQQPDQAPAQLKAPESRGSIQRASPKGEFLAHQNLPDPAGELPFSPGRFDLTPAKN